MRIGYGHWAGCLVSTETCFVGDVTMRKCNLFREQEEKEKSLVVETKKKQTEAEAQVSCKLLQASCYNTK